MRGADALSDDYKYLPVQRLAGYIEESFRRGTRWAADQPNDESLWSQLRLSIGSFMGDMFRQGAFQGASAKEAFFVTCDSSTTTKNEIDAGVANVMLGFAPLKPAEYVILYLQLAAGRSTE